MRLAYFEDHPQPRKSDVTPLFEVVEVEKQLRRLNIKQTLKYKPDICTILGMFRYRQYLTIQDGARLSVMHSSKEKT